MQIQLWAERCSGSNFLQSLISENLPSLEVTAWPRGFKHWFPERPYATADGTIILSRGPVSWLSSLYRKMHHVAPELRNLPFSAFIRARWRCVWKDGSEMATERDPETGELFRNVLDMRNCKHRVWLQDKPAFVLTYERLAANPEVIVKELAHWFEVPVPSVVRVPLSYKGKMTWRRKLCSWATLGLLGRYRPTKYAPVTSEDRAFIEAQIDPEVEQRLGFTTSRNP